MAVPATTARSTPGGIPFEDGYQSLIAFERDADIEFWEIEVTPPGIENGDPIDTTTMHNTLWRTRAARALIDLTPIELLVAYDATAYTSIRDNLVKQSGGITVHLPDGSTLDFFGYLQNFIPDALAEGTRPEANITIVPTNWDPTNNVEQGPVLSDVTGT